MGRAPELEADSASSARTGRGGEEGAGDTCAQAQIGEKQLPSGKGFQKRCCRKWRVEMSQDRGVGLCEQPTWAHSSFAPSCELRGRGGRGLLARGGRKRGRTGNETLI